MKAWHVIGIVMALIPLCFLTMHRFGGTGPASTATLAAQMSHTRQRVLFYLVLGAAGALVHFWAATPPL